MKRSGRIGRNAKRQDESFVRNFHSSEYVDFTRWRPCIFCDRWGVRAGVRTAHVLEGRKMGGRGGDWTDTAPVCFTCDTEWATGHLTFMEKRGITRLELEHRVALHHNAFRELCRSD